MATTAQPFGAALIGRTEKALNAILDRLLAGTGLTEPQWVTLTLAVTGGDVDRAEFVRRVSDAARFSPASVGERIAELTTAGFLGESDDGCVQVTEKGQARWTQVRDTIVPITQDLWGDLPPEDVATAGRVLNVVLDRAGTQLAR